MTEDWEGIMSKLREALAKEEATTHLAITQGPLANILESFITFYKDNKATMQELAKQKAAQEAEIQKTQAIQEV